MNLTDTISYKWDKNGNLVSINWLDASLKGSISFSNFTKLENLNCCLNNLTDLDISGCTDLTYLCCYDNSLTSLDVSNNMVLKDLICYSNNITSLDASYNIY